jgi:O-antigen/teichoic acid export membrane protein
MSLSQRSITSAAWNIVANLVQVAVGFGRYVLLARLLAVETFGIYAGASAVVGLTVSLASFGMGGAFLHRADETTNEEQTARVHFVLKSAFTLLWIALMIAGTLLFATGGTRTALLVLTATTGVIHFTETPGLLLVRRVVHRRLALIQLVNALLTTIVAVGLAWQGMELWALLGTDVATALLMFGAFYVWRPVWRPRLAWSARSARYFLRFGARNALAIWLSQALDRVDDLWTRFYLGTTAMGYYSRAYRLASFPGMLLAGPINTVAGGTFAELKGDRLRLSRAFYRTNAFLVRSGFALAGLLALVAPEFTRLVLGEKWMPMLDAFRLMLVFTLLDPMKRTVAGLFVAMGRPGLVVRVRAVQLALLVGGLVLLSPALGIVGVALAVNIMLAAGIGILLWLARAYVDFSVTRLLGAPGLAVGVGLVAGWVAVRLLASGSDWLTGGVKVVAFSCAYAGIMLFLERGQTLKGLLYLASRLQLEE